LARRFRVPVGLSDHSADTLPSIAAIALGASLIEVHLALHRTMFGPDTKASLLPDQLTEVCRARDAIHTMLTHAIDKDMIAGSLAASAAMFGRSLALRSSQAAGTILQPDMLTLKKPGTGIPASKRCEYVGRRLNRAVAADRLLRPEDFEPVAGSGGG
jgi:N-acetylneuraminate synthase